MEKATAPGGRRGGVELSIGVSARGWSFPGGDEDDDSVTLWIAGQGRSWTVRVPITVDGQGDLVVGVPEVAEALPGAPEGNR